MNRTATITAVIIIVILLLLGGGYYLASRNNKPSSYGITPTPTPTASATPTATPLSSQSSPTATTQMVSISVIGQNYLFTPKEITVSKGSLVKVNFTAKDSSHTFTLPDFNVDTGLVSPGSSRSVQFVADKTGTFQFYCIPHKSMGMTGTLKVE